MIIFQISLLNWISLLSSFFVKDGFEKNMKVSVGSVKNKSTIRKKNEKEFDTVNSFQSKTNKDYIEQLNQEDIYLLVTDGFANHQKKSKKDELPNPMNTLLLIHTQDRLSNTSALKQSRFNKIFLKGKQDGFFLNDNYRRQNGFQLERMVDPRFELSSYFKNPTIYYRQNKGGYKSICPVFFEKNEAELFLKDIYEENLGFLSILRTESKNDIFDGICGTKIIQVGLGDFINFYTNEQPNTLDQVDFLFFPRQKDLKAFSRWNPFKLFSSRKSISTKSFFSYSQPLHRKKESSVDWEYNITLTDAFQNSHSYLDYYYDKYKSDFLQFSDAKYKLMGSNSNEVNELKKLN